MKMNLLAGLASASKKRPIEEEIDTSSVVAGGKRRPLVEAVDHLIPLSPDELAAPPSAPYDYTLEARYFQLFALQVYDRGWMPVPQTRGSEERRPGLVDGRTLHWGQYTETRAPRDTVTYWARDPKAGFCNLAVILGKPSGNTFAIDADIMGIEHNNLVQQLCVEHFGDTMVRYGRKPKALLLYRVADAADLPLYGKFVIAGPEGQPNGDMVEILGNGRMVTMLGLHHFTQEPFQYDNGQPQIYSPQERVTLVTAAQIRAFLDALAEALPLHVPERAKYAELDLASIDSTGIRVPHVKAWSSSEWIETDGLVSDGREAFMYSTAREFARNNPGASPEVLVPLVIDAFRKREHPQRAWPAIKVQEQAHEKVGATLRAVQSGRISPARRRRKSAATPETPSTDITLPIPRRSPQVRTEGPPLSFLPLRRRSHIAVEFSKPDPELAAERAIQDDRTLVGAEAAASNIAGIDAFIRDVIACNNRVHVLSGATGIGKSSMTLKRLAEMMGSIFSNVVEHDDAEGAAEQLGALVMLVPTYNNVEDLRTKAAMLHLDGDATDAELIEAAAKQGIVAEGDLKDHLEQLKRFAVSSGLEYTIYKGKVAAGCLRAEEMRLLQSSNVPTSAMCRTKARLKDALGDPTGEPVVQLCKFYNECPAIRQKAELAGKHLVFMVRNFLTLNLPEELQSPRGLVIDERFFDLLIHESTMPLSTLNTGRREPILGKKEWAAGMRPADLLQDREEAVGHAMPVLRQRGDLARHFADLVVTRDNGKKVLGINLVKAARRVCGSAMTSQADLSPDVSLDEIRSLCVAPKGTKIGEEYRFWAILEDQVQTLLDAQLDSTVVVAPDHRIRVLGEMTATAEDGTITELDPDVQMAWRSDPNWSTVPTLLLDASTDETITSLAMGGRDVVMHRTPVNLNQHVVLSVDRRLSNKSLFPGKDAPIERKVEAATLLHELRTSIAMFAGTHAHGRVLIVTTMRIRRALLKDWAVPANIDVRHYGATAGLDFARQHVGMMFISRMELPVRTVDGLVAALSFGQATPEQPIDPMGTGLDGDGDGEDLEHNIVRHAHPLRDGGSATWDRDQHAGNLARRIQKQYREMEQMQGIGRLRSVYRETAGMVLGISSTPPEDLVADEIVGLKDLTQDGVFWDAVRICGGVVNAEFLARFAPHLGEVAQFERMIGDEFLANALVVSRHHRVTAVLADGTEQTLYIPGHNREWRHTLGPQLREMGWRGILTNVVDCSVQTVAAEEAPVDDIDKVLAAMIAYAGESMKLNALQDLLIARGEWRPIDKWTDPFGRSKGKPVKAPQGYRAGSGEMAQKALPLGVWMAMDVIADPWVRDGMLTPAEMIKLDLTEKTVRARKAG